MPRETIIDEVRETRARLLEEAGGSIRALCDRLRELEAKSKEPIVKPPPKPRDEVA
ncbi:MAG: hypothetical protein HZB39_21525 [Planctomycetes bacterium]|nr:hypothetical protein [Planctomycetota bacterium]